MKFLSKEKFKVLAERNGWSLSYAEGYINGEYLGWRGDPPGRYPMIGIDEYCLGFRAGYYRRQYPGLFGVGRTDTLEIVQTSVRPD